MLKTAVVVDLTFFAFLMQSSKVGIKDPKFAVYLYSM